MKLIALILLLPLTGLAQGFSDASAPFLLASSSLRRGLLGYWRLEEASGTRYDCSQYGNHLGSSNNVGQTTGKVGNCATFTAASSQWLEIPTSSVSLAGSNWTICAWFNRNGDSASSYRAILSKERGVGTYEARIFVFNGHLDIGIDSNFSAVTPDPATTGWQFVIAQWVKSSGVLSAAMNGTSLVPILTNSANWGPGAFLVGKNATANYWSGYIDEIGVWSRLLSTNEAAFVYQSGVGTHFPWAHP